MTIINIYSKYWTYKYEYPKEYFKIKMRESRYRWQLKKIEKSRANICNSN